MPKMSSLTPALSLLLVLAAAHPVSAADGCLAADVNDSGDVDFLDLNEISAAISAGLPDPRLDLDGSGLPDSKDLLMAFGHVFEVCTGCTADLDDDGDVDSDDREVLEAAYDRDCRLNLDRNDVIDEENDVEIWLKHFQSLPSPADARADFDGNGIVNFIDLSLVIPTIGNVCRPDLNGDGWVNVNDLCVLHSQWGLCP